MKSFVLSLLSLVSLVVMANAQRSRIEMSDREKDGFTGAVRRVKVETAPINVKEGNPVEGSREVRAITTYDIKGKRVDTVAHPVQATTPAGREQYKYDAKGNIIEMTVIGTDGAILSRETYRYEFDDIGNWKKMTALIATYENGKLNFEPIEVTYRTLTYYYNQTIERVVKSSAVKPGPANSEGGPVAMSNSVSAQPAAAGFGNDLEEKDQPKSTSDSVVPLMTNPTPPETVAVKHVSESVLKAAAINLPSAKMPLVGQLQVMFRRVQVHVVINEKGDVQSARGTSPEAVFNQAAEAAALKARFSPDKLADKPTRVFSVITYDFSTEVAPPSLPSVAVEKANPKVTLDGEAPPATVTNAAPAEKVDPFAQGVVHLNNREYAKAEEFFKALAYRNPEDAKSYNNLGIAYYGQQKYVEALAAFKLAIKLRPELVDANTYYLMGASYHALKKYSEAEKALEQGIYVLRAAKVTDGSTDTKLFPSLFQFHYNLGVIYQSIGSNFEAIKAFRKAVSLNPEAAEPHYGMALVYISMGDRVSTEREQRILRKLDEALARKVADALASRTLYIPPGCTALPCP